LDVRQCDHRVLGALNIQYTVHVHWTQRAMRCTTKFVPYTRSMSSHQTQNVCKEEQFAVHVYRPSVTSHDYNIFMSLHDVPVDSLYVRAPRKNTKTPNPKIKLVPTEQYLHTVLTVLTYWSLGTNRSLVLLFFYRISRSAVPPKCTSPARPPRM